MAVHPWGKTSAGHPVASVILTNGPLTVEIITLGAAIRDMRLAGHAFPLVLGLNSVAEYQNHGLYFGAVVGRFANRIAGARFQLDGTTYELPENDNGSVLHGGAGGFSSRVWDIDDVSERHVTLTLESPDGDMGFAAAVTARCTYALSEAGVLDVTLEATSDAPTVCAMAQHAYFNLEDGGASSVHSHDLQVQAEAFLQKDARNIPAGAPEAVAGTPFDFQTLRQLEFMELDHNFCLDQARGPLRHAARLASARSGVALDVSTTEPGVQVYTADHVPQRTTGLDGISYGPRSGIALETQVWPDAPNRIDFPSAVLRPGEPLKQVTRLAFKRARRS